MALGRVATGAPDGSGPAGLGELTPGGVGMGMHVRCGQSGDPAPGGPSI